MSFVVDKPFQRYPLVTSVPRRGTFFPICADLRKAMAGLLGEKCFERVIVTETRARGGRGPLGAQRRPRTRRRAFAFA